MSTNQVSHLPARLLLPMILFFALSSRYSSGAATDVNLLHNGNLAEGSGDAPTAWSRVSHGYLSPTKAAEAFQWNHVAGAPAELKLTSRKHSIRRWEQPVNLVAGAYCLSGEMRSEIRNPLASSSNVSLQLSSNMIGVSWSDNSNSPDWKKGKLYFKVGLPRHDASVACILMGVGTVACRNLKLVRLSSPTPPGAIVVDLDLFKEKSNAMDFPRPFAKPSGEQWTIIATMLSLVVLTLLGWRALGPGDT